MLEPPNVRARLEQLVACRATGQAEDRAGRAAHRAVHRSGTQRLALDLGDVSAAQQDHFRQQTHTDLCQHRLSDTRQDAGERAPDPLHDGHARGDHVFDGRSCAAEQQPEHVDRELDGEDDQQHDDGDAQPLDLGGELPESVRGRLATGRQHRKHRVLVVLAGADQTRHVLVEHLPDRPGEPILDRLACLGEPGRVLVDGRGDLVPGQ
ncbi:hypothetical protein [Phytohabitans flavus]|uniref:hypothetical protein n=1 Tax=Phytohabitans flavus TaxID=1076124 RepID=UPI0015668C8D|nr:hypothetical protein [Phytohabitans flavus]